MISLLGIGFGLLVIAFRLTTLRNSILRAGEISAPFARQILVEGRKTCIAGLIVLLVGILGIYCNLMLNSEAAILMGTGATLIILGILSLVQWTVQSGRGTEHHVYIGARIVKWFGVVLVIAYAIYRIVMILS